MNIYGGLYNINWFVTKWSLYWTSTRLPFKTNQVSGEVFLPHSAGLLAPRFTGALLPESTQGQWCHLIRPSYAGARSAAGEATSCLLCFFRRRFLVSCSTSVCICCTSPQPIYWSKCPRCKTGEYRRAWARISRKMENLLSCFRRSMSRLGLVLLFLQYVSELGFHIARLFYFTDENHQKM